MRGASTRLFLLAELATRGEAHGHELRREAALGKTELWSEVGIGSIYSTLRRMQAEGLVRIVRSERDGLMPERTVYALTSEGRKELEALRASMLRDVVVRADPFDLALACSPDLPTEVLLGIVEDRTATIRTRISSLEHLRDSARDHLDDRDHLLFDHVLTRLRAELDWHDTLHTALSANRPPRPESTRS
ncbi:PadR family transcriptional regulator [Nocardia terpenica]|uniref:PadR family transcriptional regulator n=1 Tax=Nocardia terpenica TaxID=455432 RepID=UPI00082E574F|nr:PadR family transcriptional regulator [Nocardia terpenica]NQE92678.1 PadR family transcriptional regulator [Nocardia terpenica]